MSKVNPDSFIVVKGYMLTEMKLKGNELLVYAIIHGFSQTEDKSFKGSLRYLADWCNSSKQGIQKNLKSLVSKGYITKNDVYVDGVKYCIYKDNYFKLFQNSKKAKPTGYKRKAKESDKLLELKRSWGLVD